MNFMKIVRSYFLRLCHTVVCFAVFVPIAFSADSSPTTDSFCYAPASEDLVSGTTSLHTASSELEPLRVLLYEPPHSCAIGPKEKQLIEQFAALNKRHINWNYVESPWQLLSELIAGNGDIVLAQDQNLAAGMDGQARFTHVWTDAAYKIVQRSDSNFISRFSDLAGRQVAAYKDSVIWPILEELEASLTGLVLREVPVDVPYLEVMERVKTGEYDLVVADSLFLDAYLPANPELNANFNLSPKRNMAWAVHPDAEELQQDLNQYLNQQHLTHDIATIYFEDLSEIKDRRTLRLITSSNPAHYYLQNGSLRGFEYELLKEFASQYKMRVDVVIAKSHEEMFTLLKEGRGDMIAASLPANVLNSDTDIQFTKAYKYASPVIIGRNTETPLIDISELSGRRITLAKDSPYWDYALSLQTQGAEFELTEAEPGVDMEATLLMVSLGMYDLTIVGGHQFNMRFAQELGLSAQFALAEPFGHHWAVRKDDQQLNNALNEFIGKHYRKQFYNVLHAKYFEQPRLPKSKNKKLTQITALSPYDDVTKVYADKYAFDWRLITALMFQESRFDPNAYSYAGAEGLMQLIPTTAELMGVHDTNNPEANINGGVRYLSYLRDKFEDSLLLQDRIWFTLASYNAGYGYIKKARVLATEMGLDKNKWFDNVELAMLAMAKPFMRDGEQVRYCRCGQAVVYVREIRTRYFNYIRLLETQNIAAYSPSVTQLSRFN